MKTVHAICLALAALTLSSPLLAQTRATSGKIRFIGKIVEGGCNVVPQAQIMQVSCYRDGKMRFTRSPCLRQAMRPLCSIMVR